MSFTKLASKLKYNKSIESVSRRRTQLVRDSQLLSTGTFTGLILVLSLFLVNNTYATSNSITITLDDNIVDLNVAPTTNGAFSKSNASKIGVATTNYTGYTLSISAQGEDNPTKLMNGNEGLTSIEKALTEDEFKALDATSYNNMWGYLPSKYNSTSNTSFLPSPTADGDTLDVTSTANTTVNEYEITLGARVDTTASLGSYSNVFLVEAVANAIAYTIIFDDNVVGSMPTDINDETTGATVTLPNNVPVRDGYTFLGWCTVVPTNTNGTDACTGGTTYSTSGTLTLNQEGGANDYHLYAIWSKNKSIEDLNYMQDFANLSSAEKTSVLNSTTTGQKYFLFDNRDMEAYAIAKLKDGRVWMLDNLRLGGTSPITLTNSNSNISDSTWTLPASISSGFSSYTEAQINADYKNNTTTSYGAGSGKAGVYYNYCAASAGTYCYGVGNGNGDTQYDICPANWRMPTGGDAGEYWNLDTIYSDDHDGLRMAFSISFSGYYENSSVYNQNLATGLWSGTIRNGNSMYIMRVDSSTISSRYVTNRYFGNIVRCILK